MNNKYFQALLLIVISMVSHTWSAPLLYSTFLGGSGSDGGSAIAIDSVGNVYITGYAYSLDFPVTVNGIQTSNQDTAAGSVAFVTKINTSLSGDSSLVYSTYLGGSGNASYSIHYIGNFGDAGQGIAVDFAGNVYLTGYTFSTDFPVTSNAFQTIAPDTVSNGSNAFVSIIHTDTFGISTLVYSTYLGGSGNGAVAGDAGTGITIDSVGNVYLTGYTYSTNFPVTANAIITSLRSSSGIAFVSKISPSLSGTSSLIFSTYLGGSGGEAFGDEGSGIAIDSADNIYITGRTASPDFPVTSNAFSTTLLSSYYGDAFVTKLNISSSNITTLLYSTYLGGSLYNYSHGIAVDSFGNAYVTGFTNSGDFPITANAFSSTGGIFVSKINTNSSGTASLIYSTSFGGGSGYGIVVDSSGNAYVTGFTTSKNFPVTTNAFQTISHGQSNNAVVSKINTNGSGTISLLYSSYLGGGMDDYGEAIAIDKSGNAYITGIASSPNFPLTSNAFCTTLKGYSDAFVTKLMIPQIPSAGFYANPTSGFGPLQVNFHDISGNNPTSWDWNFGDGGTNNTQNPIHIYSNVPVPTSYSVQLIIKNLYGTSTAIYSNYITVFSQAPPYPGFYATPTSGTFPFTIEFIDTSANNPLSWAWDFGDGGTSTAQNPSHNYLPGIYTVKLIVSNTFGSSTMTHVNYITVNQSSSQISGFCKSLINPIDTQDISDDIYDMVVQDNYLYNLVAGGVFEIYDLSNPASPTLIDTYTYAGSGQAVGMNVSGKYAYVADGAVYGDQYWAGFHIIDVSNPTSPVLVGENIIQTAQGHPAVNGNYVYVPEVSYLTDPLDSIYSPPGIRIWDVSNPDSPIPIGFAQSSTDAQCVAYQGNDVFVGCNDGMRVYDVSTPSNPTEIGYYNSSVGYGYAVYGIEIRGSYAYLANGGLQIIDISNPSQPVLIGYTQPQFSPAVNITLNGNYAYIASEEAGLRIIDISSSTNPIEVDSYYLANTGQGFDRVQIKGGYAYIADNSLYYPWTFRILEVAQPVVNEQIFLSGNINQTTVTDTTGYYQFSNLTYGNYSVTPFPFSYIVNPSYWSYSGLSSNRMDQDFYLNVYSYTSTMGDFSNATDTEFWAFQPANGLSNQATVSWLSTYQGDSGILQINFSSATEGVKLTSFARFTPSTTNPWYRLRVTYYCDAPCENEQILPLILLYNSALSETIQELGGAYTGNTLIQPGEWNTIETYVYCHSSSGQIQLMAKNYGDTGAMYIDSIELDNVTPPAITSPTYVSVTAGDFATGDETTGWGFENVYNEPNGQPTISWLPTVNGQTGVLALSFTTSSQGVKMTSLDVFSIPTGSNAMMSFNIAVDQSSPTALSIMGFQYAEKDVVDEEFDIGAYGNFGIMSGSTTWTTFYVPLTSFTQSTHRLQLLIRNGSQHPETVYLNDIELFYGVDSPDSSTEYVLEPKTLELCFQK